jgi:hypothetical protein
MIWNGGTGLFQLRLVGSACPNAIVAAKKAKANRTLIFSTRELTECAPE